jgi:hypothetical protein
VNRTTLGGIIFGTSVVLALGSLAGASHVPGPPPPADAKEPVEAANKKFEELRAAITSFNAAVSRAIDADVKEERLKEAKGNKKDNWSCEAELLKATATSKQERDNIRQFVKKMKPAWETAKGTATRSCPPGSLPWMADQEAISKSVSAAESIFQAIDSSKTSTVPHRAELWKKAQAYATGMPKGLATVQAKDLVPQRVNVQCIGETVEMRSGGD